MTRRNLDDPQERSAALGDLEALLFAAARPLSLPEIARRLYLEEPLAAELVDLLDQELSRPERGLQLRQVRAKWQLETKADREDAVAGLRSERGARPLTARALETLAVVALRHPVTTEEVTAICGAAGYGTIETLRRQKLVARSEPRSAEGHAARWRTTPALSRSVRHGQPSRSSIVKAASRSSSVDPLGTAKRPNSYRRLTSLSPGANLSVVVIPRNGGFSTDKVACRLLTRTFQRRQASLQRRSCR